MSLLPCINVLLELTAQKRPYSNTDKKQFKEFLKVVEQSDPHNYPTFEKHLLKLIHPHFRIQSDFPRFVTEYVKHDKQSAKVTGYLVGWKLLKRTKNGYKFISFIDCTLLYGYEVAKHLYKILNKYK